MQTNHLISPSKLNLWQNVFQFDNQKLSLYMFYLVSLVKVLHMQQKFNLSLLIYEPGVNKLSAKNFWWKRWIHLKSILQGKLVIFPMDRIPPPPTPYPYPHTQPMPHFTWRCEHFSSLHNISSYHTKVFILSIQSTKNITSSWNASHQITGESPIDCLYNIVSWWWNICIRRFDNFSGEAKEMFL